MILKTPRLMLMLPAKEHAEGLLANWGSDRAVFETITSVPIDTIEKVHAVISASIKGYEEERVWRWSVIEIGTSQPIGFITLTRKEDGKAELGYSLGSKFWGCGYATEAVKAVLSSEYAAQFEQIHATVFVKNLASLRVLRKAGFGYCGIVRRRSVYGADCIKPGGLCHMSVFKSGVCI